ncbi:hypothetical protein ACE6H2_017041 [Prunus campanulata]
MMVETISNPSQGKATTPSLTWLQAKSKARMDNDVVIPSRSLGQSLPCEGEKQKEKNRKKAKESDLNPSLFQRGANISHGKSSSQNPKKECTAINRDYKEQISEIWRVPFGLDV